jgi:hypothetical protein
MKLIILVLVAIVIALVLFKYVSGYASGEMPSPSAPGLVVQDQYSQTIKTMLSQGKVTSEIIKALIDQGLTTEQAFNRLTQDPFFGHQEIQTPGPPPV